MIVHELINIAQETRSDDAHDSKRNADQIHVPITLGIRLLPRRDHDRVRGCVARDARDQLQFVDQRCAGEHNGFPDVCRVFDSELEDHGAANIFGCVGDEFVDEHIVVGRVADAAADDADCESQGGYRSDEVLRMAG